MFALAIVIGIFSYIIFSLGVLHLLYAPIIICCLAIGSVGVLSVIVYYYRNDKVEVKLKKFFAKKNLKNQPLVLLFTALSIVLFLVYFIGALVPEFAFDAVWYHLTFPKIYLQNHAIFHITGGLFYYSDMPKLTEMLYTAVFANDIAAHLIHLGFGVLVAVTIFLFSKKFLPVTYALLASLIFYSNIIVGWESTTAYIDLARTFFEFLALFGFINFIETKNRTWFIESSVMLGLAIATKLVAISSLLIFIPLIFMVESWSLKEKVKAGLFYMIIALLVVSPWFVFSLLNTGNPVYPLFSGYGISTHYLSIPRIFSDLWKVFVQADDPISPVYLIVMPLVFLMYKKMSSAMKYTVIYSFLAIVVWILTPRTGGGRFMLVYLPAFSVISAYVIYMLKDKVMQYGLIALVIFLCFVTIGYRSLAEAKYSAYFLGRQSRDVFLSTHLNFNFGDFYDTDHYFADTITSKDMVLTYGIHNLYYADFPFVDASYIQPGTAFNYILVGENSRLPSRFKNWQLIYENQKTHVKLYNFQRQTWIY